MPCTAVHGPRPAHELKGSQQVGNQENEEYQPTRLCIEVQIAVTRVLRWQSGPTSTRGDTDQFCQWCTLGIVLSSILRVSPERRWYNIESWLKISLGQDLCVML